MIEIKSKLIRVGFDLPSVSIIQTEYSTINHRNECDPFIFLCGRKVYPVIVAPMGSVTNEHNYKVWLDKGFICVVPRTVDFDKRLKISKETFVSVSLSEAETLCSDKLLSDGEMHYICVDIAHGTMERLYKACSALRDMYGDKIKIMTGNVATPKAYLHYVKNGIDFMRTGIGSGSRCTTACNVGVYYPMATLIDELRMEKDKYLHGTSYNGTITKIIPDGGISNFDDIQKCLALGAYAVMSGKIFAKAEEASEPIVFLHPNNLNMADAIPSDEYYEKLKELKERSDIMEDENNEYSIAYRKLSQRKPYRLYYGMSTKKAQKLTGGSGNTTAEGIAKPVLVEYPIDKWADNMASYIRSCMSYTGCRTIQELRENTELIIDGSGDGAYRK